MTYSLDLTGRVALAIGGSGGIGRVLSEGLAKAGATVAIAARDRVKIEQAVAAIEAAGGRASAELCDAQQLEMLPGLFDTVLATHGRLDILLNCQGINIIKPALDVSPADYDAVMNTNLRSLFFACLAAHGAFKAQGRGGVIINIASLAAHRGWPGAAVYGASKHAVLGLTRGLAAEWAGDGIRVNAISPGFFMTEMNRDRMNPARKEAALRRTPFGRFGEVEELVGAAVFLASDEARFITGTDLAVDGGYLAGGI